MPEGVQFKLVPVVGGESTGGGMAGAVSSEGTGGSKHIKDMSKVVTGFLKPALALFLTGKGGLLSGLGGVGTAVTAGLVTAFTSASVVSAIGSAFVIGWSGVKMGNAILDTVEKALITTPEERLKQLKEGDGNVVGRTGETIFTSGRAVGEKISNYLTGKKSSKEDMSTVSGFLTALKDGTLQQWLKDYKNTTDEYVSVSETQFGVQEEVNRGVETYVSLLDLGIDKNAKYSSSVVDLTVREAALTKVLRDKARAYSEVANVISGRNSRLYEPSEIPDGGLYLGNDATLYNASSRV